jgi:hypothetical protein
MWHHGQASIEDVNYRAARRLDKALLQQLAAGLPSIAIC